MSRFVSAGFGALRVPPAPPAPEPDALAVTGDFGAHPSILSQPSTGRAVNDIELHNGKIFLGHGDWTANTGPIDVAYFDTGTGTFGVALPSAPTEAFDRFRAIGGKLFAPWIDSHPSMPFLGLSTDLGGVWHNVDNGTYGALHIFDVASFTGNPNTDLYMCGATIIDGAGHGIIYKSTDAGASWTLTFDQGNPGGFSRIHAMHNYGGKLYAVGSAGTFEFDGSSWGPWSGGTFDVGQSKGYLTQGILVSIDGWFDGTTSSGHADGPFKTICVDGLDRLWGVRENHLYNGVYSAGSLTWTRLGHLTWDDFMPSRIVVDGSTLYVVGADAAVRTAALPTVP